jgi:hypothetical protein
MYLLASPALDDDLDSLGAKVACTRGTVWRTYPRWLACSDLRILSRVCVDILHIDESLNRLRRGEESPDTQNMLLLRLGLTRPLQPPSHQAGVVSGDSTRMAVARSHDYTECAAEAVPETSQEYYSDRTFQPDFELRGT